MTVVQPQTRPRAGVGTASLVAATLIAASLAEGPLLYKFFLDLWQRPQYEFFPLLLAALPFITISILRDVPADDVRPGGRGVTIGLAMMAWLALAGGAALYIKAAAPVSTVLLAAAGAWAVGGRGLVRALVPMGVLVLLIVPPPGHYDETVLVALRHWAVLASGRVLDALGVPVFVQGAVIAVPGDRLMVAEACSGINSMLAVLAFTVLVTFWQRLPVAWLAGLLPAAFAYVFWANVLRITLCAVARVRWGVDLLSGSVHELLGMVLFVGCMGLVYSTVALGRAILGDPDGARDSAPAAPSWPTLRAGPWLSAAGAMALTGVLVWWRVHAAWPASQLPGPASFELPKTLAGWTRLDANAAAPEKAETSGRFSRLWQYRKGGRTVTVGLDYPFYGGYHDATICYAMAGWRFSDTREGPAAADGRRPFVVTMQKPPLTEGDLRFALCDESGTWWQRPAAIPGESAAAFALRLARERAVSRPLAQVQLLSVGYRAATADEERGLDELFGAAAGTLGREISQAAGGER